MTTATKPNPTRQSIGAMIDEARCRNVLAGYIMLIGHAPHASRAGVLSNMTTVRPRHVSDVQ